MSKFTKELVDVEFKENGFEPLLQNITKIKK